VLGGVLDGWELAKACITDPPYNVPTSGHIRSTQKHAEFAMAAGEMDDQDFTGCCQTNDRAHQYLVDGNFYEVTKERHSVRAASRFSLNVERFESDLCELNRL